MSQPSSLDAPSPAPPSPPAGGYGAPEPPPEGGFGPAGEQPPGPLGGLGPGSPEAVWKPNYWFLGGVSLINLVADLGTKYWAEKALQTASLIPTPKSIFKAAYGGFGFMLARNPGGAWGLLHNQDEKYRKPFFVTVSVLAIIFIVSLFRRLHPSQTALRWGLPMVLGGAIGNLVDRVRYGKVIDFIDFYAVWGGTQHHWPTFNVADISICVGVGLMAVDMLTSRRPDLEPAPPAPPPAPVAPVEPAPPGPPPAI